MKCSLGISNFLEEISSLSRSIIFLYFFALITEEGFLISPCYSLELLLLVMLLGVLFNLLIEDGGLIKVDLSAILDPFNSNQFMLCPWAMLFFQKLCLAPFPPVTIWFPCFPRDSQESSPAPQFKSINSLVLSLFSHPDMTAGKTIALTRWSFVSKVMSLLFNMLSMLVIAFLPRSKCLLISWLQSPSAQILDPKKIKSVTVSIFSPSICHEVMGRDAMILVFWILGFKPRTWANH